MINLKALSNNGKKVSLVTAAVLTIASPFVAREEGLRTAAYLDSVGVPTICYGETEGVRLGQTKTKQECDALFNARLGAFAMAVDAMIEPPMPPETHAAFTSWAYNVGLGAARKSTLVRTANTGDLAAACYELPKWKYAGKKPILEKRRMREWELCLNGLRLK